MVKKLDPDLLQSILKPSPLAKDELRMILFKMNKFRPNIQEFGIAPFQMSGEITDSRQRRPAGTKSIVLKAILILSKAIQILPKAILTFFNPFSIRKHLIAASQTRKIAKKWF